MSVVAKVADVLSKYEIVFNAGTDAGVKMDDVALLLRSREVKDPETGEVLGKVRRSIARFKIVEVQPKLSVGRSLDTFGEINLSQLFTASPSSSGPVLKSVTLNPAERGESTVLVEIGQEALIQTPESETPSKKATAK